MSKPARESQRVNNDVWYYESNSSIHVVVWVTGRDGQRVCTSFRIPWRKLKRSMRRCTGAHV